MSRIASSVLAVLICSTGAAFAEDGCSRDVDCKGERICVQRECVEPPPPAYPPLPPAVPEPPRSSTVESAQPPMDSAPVSSSAPAAATRAREPEHHRGLFFRSDLGIGYLSSTISQSGSDTTASGAAASFGLAFGGTIAHNQILAFHVWDLGATNPTISSGGFSTSNANTSFTVVGLGPEYTVYSQRNFYFSISPSVSRLSLEGNGVTSDSDWGFGLRTAVGKEWWVSANWGLGIVAQFSLSVNKDNGASSPTWTTFGATLAFSATYN
jgi:hypothetical protein